MEWHHWTPLLAGLVCVALPAALHAADTIVLTQSAGYVHDVVKPRDGGPSVVEQVLSDMAASSGVFEPTFSGDVSELTPDRLADAKLLIFYTTGPLPISDEQYDALERWVRDGGAFLGIHCATDTLKDHPRYPKLIGGVFDGHPWNANEMVTIKVQDGQHPAATPYAPEATFKEEVYQFRDFDAENVRVLISLDMQKTELKKPYHVPIAWCKRVGDGRVFYTSLGHRQDVWESQAFQAHLLGAIRWLLGQAEGSAEPNPQVHERENEIAEAAANGEQPPAESTQSAAPRRESPARASELGLDPQSHPARPRDPWVFRSVLDEKPRMLTIALHEDLWLAYDATDANLDQAWDGGVNFQGAVYTGAHGPQPTSRVDTLFYCDADDEPAWRVLHAGEPVEFEQRYRGYRFNEDGTVTLLIDLVLPDGQTIRVAETPEAHRMAPGYAGLTRKIEVRQAAPDHEVAMRPLHDARQWVEVATDEPAVIEARWPKGAQ